jgi:hypothetical protein
LPAWQSILGMLDVKGRLKLAEFFADGSFSPAKKGAQRSARASVARAQR